MSFKKGQKSHFQQSSDDESNPNGVFSPYNFEGNLQEMLDY
jgi:hypothetical protein